MSEVSVCKLSSMHVVLFSTAHVRHFPIHFFIFSDNHNLLNNAAIEEQFEMYTVFNIIYFWTRRYVFTA